MGGENREKNKAHSSHQATAGLKRKRTHDTTDDLLRQRLENDPYVMHQRHALRRRQGPVNQTQARPLPMMKPASENNNFTTTSMLQTAMRAQRPMLQPAMRESVENQIRKKLNSQQPLLDKEARYMAENPTFVQNLDINQKQAMVADAAFLGHMRYMHDELVQQQPQQQPQYDPTSAQALDQNLIGDSSLSTDAMYYLQWRYGITNTDNVLMAGFYNNVLVAQPQYAAVPVQGVGLGSFTPQSNLQMDNMYKTSVQDKMEHQHENMQTYLELRNELKADGLEMSLENLEYFTEVRLENKEEFNETKAELKEYFNERKHELDKDNEEKFEENMEEIIEEFVEDKMEARQKAAFSPYNLGNY